MSRAVRRALAGAALAWATLAAPRVANAAPGAPLPDATYALVVGNDQPPPGGKLAPLRYADDDAVRFTELFESFGATVTLLTVMDGPTQQRYPAVAARSIPPTLGAFDAALRGIRQRVDRDLAAGRHPQVFVTFSGHGGTTDGGAGFLAFADGPLDRAAWMASVVARFRDVPLHMIVDACHAGSVVGVRGAFDRELDATVESTTPEVARNLLGETALDDYPLAGALVSSAPEGESHEWSRIESGVFTHEVVSGLRGAADVDGNLEIEYSELRAFVAAANRDLPDPRARPTIVAHTPVANGRAVLASLRRLVGARLLRGTGAVGHFYVERADGQRVLEANLDGSQRFSVVIDAVQLAYLRTQGREAAIAPSPDPVSVGDLTFREREVAPKGSVASSLEEHLFRTPYGKPYYLGFVDSNGLVGVPFDRADPGLDRRTARGNGAVAWTFAGVSAAATVTAVVAGFLAMDARADFDREKTPAGAARLEDDYQRYGAIGVSAGAVAVGSAVAAWLFWPRAEAPVNVGMGPGPTAVWTGRW